jgi:hypothetical protein
VILFFDPHWLVIEVAKQKTPADMFEYDAEAVTFYVETFSSFSLLDTYVGAFSPYTLYPTLRKFLATYLSSQQDWTADLQHTASVLLLASYGLRR